MNDLHDLVTALGKAAPEAPVRLRRGQIVSVQSDGTVTVTVGGGTEQAQGVRVAASCCPIPNAGCWLATDGQDMFVLATMAPSGPAYGFMRKSVAQSIANTTWTEMTWASRTDTIETGVTLGSNGITVIVPGVYAVSVAVQLGGTWTTGTCYTRLLKNGATVAAGSGMPFPSTSTFAMRAMASMPIKCAAGDVINAEVYQSSGAARDQDIGAGANVLSAVWLGPSM